MRKIAHRELDSKSNTWRERQTLRCRSVEMIWEELSKNDVKLNVTVTAEENGQFITSIQGSDELTPEIPENIIICLFQFGSWVSTKHSVFKYLRKECRLVSITNSFVWNMYHLDVFFQLGQMLFYPIWQRWKRATANRPMWRSTYSRSWACRSSSHLRPRCDQRWTATSSRSDGGIRELFTLAVPS